MATWGQRELRMMPKSTGYVRCVGEVSVRKSLAAAVCAD